MKYKGLIIPVLFFYLIMQTACFGKAASKELLVASREGAANCMTVLTLKEDSSFVEKNVCFGRWQVKGNWSLKGDTILFSNVQPGREKGKYFEYALIKDSKVERNGIIGDLVLYKDETDTTGKTIWITKNDFPR